MTKTLAILALVAAAAPASVALAQPTGAPPACAGHFEVIRSDQVKPGKMAEFMKAVADHQAWYAAKGLPDHIYVGHVLGPDAGSDGYSSTIALTIHTDMSGMHAPPHAPDDAAWNAYVAEYQDSSTMMNQAVACIAPSPR